MPVFYSQSNQPRTFDFLTKGPKTVLELNGTLRRGNQSNATPGTWEGLVNSPTSFQGRPNSPSAHFNFGQGSKRTINPDCNTDKPEIHSKKRTVKSVTPEPSNFDTLFAKTGDCLKLWVNKKHVDGKGITVETESRKPKRELRAEPLKTKYDHTTQIETLALGTNVREAQEIPVPVRKNSSCQVKTINDWHSSIQTLPGSLKDRKDKGRETGRAVDKNRVLKEHNIITNEVYGTQREGTKHQRKSSRTQGMNQLSNSYLDQENRLSTLNCPMKPIVSPSNQLKTTSKEFFGHPNEQKKGAPSKKFDVFKSNFDIC